MTSYAGAEFWNYITVDERGNMTGVVEDMPESAWPDYEAFLEEQEYARKHHIKI